MGTMKYVFAVLLLAGLALAEPDSTPEAEADPAADAWYGYYGRGYGYGGYGLGYRGYYGGYGGYYGGYRGYGGYGYYGCKKRSAEADPAVLAVTHSAPAVAPLVHPYGYALGYGYGLHHAPTVGYTVEHKAIEHIPAVLAVTHSAPARSVRLTPRLRLRLRLIPLSSTPDTTGIPMLADTVLADTMADTVDTPAVDTAVTVMDAGMEVMPTTVKQTNKQINKQTNKPNE